MDNGLKAMLDHLRHRFPAAQVRLDAPDNPKGEHWIDVITDQGRASFAWRPAFGFGFYAKVAGFGEGPERIVQNPQEAAHYAEAYVQQQCYRTARAV
jgi:hypothetical protein